MRGKALCFHGRDYLDLGQAPGLNFLEKQPFTFSGWVQTMAGGTLLSFRHSQNGAPVIDLLIEGQTLRVVLRTDSQGEFGEMRLQSMAAFHKVADGAWHHFALVRQEGLRPTVFLYVDGDFQGLVIGPPEGLGPLTTDLRAVGAELYWLRRRALGPTHLTGTVDELAIYGRALSHKEIRYLSGR